MDSEQEDTFSLAPINFFQIAADCFFLEPATFPAITARNAKKYRLPDTSDLCGEESFAEVSLGWNLEGLEMYAIIKEPFSQVSYPNVQQGDSVELFIDTRDVKTSGYNTRFCHHFFFLPEPVEGQSAGEITRFRTEDAHELCDWKQLQVKGVLEKKGYILHIFIPSQCLYGYDPEQFQRLGFSYRINRAQRSSQHLSVLSQEYQVEQQPSLWSSLRLLNS